MALIEALVIRPRSPIHVHDVLVYQGSTVQLTLATILVVVAVNEYEAVIEGLFTHMATFG